MVRSARSVSAPASMAISDGHCRPCSLPHSVIFLPAVLDQRTHEAQQRLVLRPSRPVGEKSPEFQFRNVAAGRQVCLVPNVHSAAVIAA